jgi:Fe-S oxidoreductase
VDIKIMLMNGKENIVKKEQMWEFFHPIVLVCTICTGMSGNFVRMFGIVIIMEHLLMEVLG